ncbi:MAG: S8 family peptidase, partial [Natronosporangium sp.]
MTSPTDREEVLLAPGSVGQPGEIERLNRLLDRAGLRCRLGQPDGPEKSDLVELPLTGDQPPQPARAVRDALQEAGRAGQRVPELLLDGRYTVDTVEDRAEPHELVASGKKIGHGLIAWVTVPARQMPASPPWRPVARRPVVALLDSGVKPHPWLPDEPDDPFHLLAGWQTKLPVPPLRSADDRPNYGSHYGHGTFIAGIIRLAAPDARVLSLPVMSDAGKVSELRAAEALEWLVERVGAGEPVDVVCLAFGRPWDRTDADNYHGEGAANARRLRWAIHRLADQGVRVVASAGNQNSPERTAPAGYACDPQEPVASVGAGTSPATKADYSNYGDWVKHWRPGTDVVSIMPLRPTPADDGDGYAR